MSIHERESAAPRPGAAPHGPDAHAHARDAHASEPDAHAREHAHDDDASAASNFRFPEGFLWGAATSSHQVEGDNKTNDWWAWEQAGRTAEPSGLACDHYRRFREDFDIAQSLSHNAHRFSIEWSRIEPEEGRWSEEGIEHYRQVLLALHERGIEPVVTLFHYTLPQWMAEKGGWENPAIEVAMERYTEKVMREYGPLVKWWITLNEPVVQVFKGWLLGQWPPGRVRAWGTALKVLRHMLRTHVRMYHVIHAHRSDARVSIAKHALALSPDDPNRWLDRQSVKVRGHLFNHLFVEALHTGMLRVPGLFWENLPLKRTLDFIGVNYYTRDFVRNSGISLPGFVGDFAKRDHRMQRGKANDLGWEIYPEGLAQFMREYAVYDLPILVTENGIPTRNDDDRWMFLFMHLWQVARAVSEGVDVVGYLHWSLLDNFEWADGYGARFGLVEVDFETQERRIRPSAWRYAQIIRRNEL